MELNDLANRFVPGFTVNVEERSALEIQMALRQTEERLSGLVVVLFMEHLLFIEITLYVLIIRFHNYLPHLYLFLPHTPHISFTESSFGAE